VAARVGEILRPPGVGQPGGAALQVPAFGRPGIGEPHDGGVVVIARRGAGQQAGEGGFEGRGPALGELPFIHRRRNPQRKVEPPHRDHRLRRQAGAGQGALAGAVEGRASPGQPPAAAARRGLAPARARCCGCAC
jgi:hypothetical protein